MVERRGGGGGQSSEVAGSVDGFAIEFDDGSSLNWSDSIASSS